MITDWGALAAESGVSRELARRRAAAFSGLRYHLRLAIPALLEHPVTGEVTIRCQADEPTDVVLDFTSPQRVTGVLANGRPVEPVRTAEHLVVPASAIRHGDNVIEMTFTANDDALNRQADGLYSLFVPARARTAFPCFDQPDLKARFSLELNIPGGWQAVSNAPGTQAAVADRVHVRFAETAPLPTYLFAFVAGPLLESSGIRHGRTYRIWYRPSDAARVAVNLDAMLDTHAAAVTWLEAFTEIPYPFGQFDIVLIPSFQFSGMEHPGAIYYHADRLLLGPSATRDEARNRATLIAHETAHIWFGDFVTMRWFDEVWLKEVFANAMADKILAAHDREEDQALRFFLAMYPAAYAVDRSGGAHPIAQPLENLADAGRLYGPVIYQKAPIVLRQLEQLIGADAFRAGVRRYLAAHPFGTATWDDLVSALDPGGHQGLKAWAEPWIFHGGRPTIHLERQSAATAGPVACTIQVDDSAGQGLGWWQRLIVSAGDDTIVRSHPVELRERSLAFDVQEPAAFVLAGGRGLGYGAFPLDAHSRVWLLQHVERVPEPLTRAVAWVALWDALLDGTVGAEAFIDGVIRALALEREESLIERLVAMLSKAFWLFLTAPMREAAAVRIETVLSQRLASSNSPASAAMWFSAYRHLVLSAEGCRWLADVWSHEAQVPGLRLSDVDRVGTICELAVREHAGWQSMLDAQLGRTVDPDLRGRLAFLAPALSDDPGTRETAWAELADVAHRRREPWVLARVQWLNHPLRQVFARRFIVPGLDLLPELARTGDIFFPSRWASALLGGHGSAAAVALVDAWLRQRQDVDEPLRRNVLVAADVLFAAARPR